MSWRKRILALAAIAVVTTIAFLALTGEREPVSRGEPLSTWYRQWYQYRRATSHENQLRLNEATQAIKDIAPDAIPYALKRVCVNDSWARSSFAKWAVQRPMIGAPIIKMASRSADKIAYGTTIFRILGTNASPAIPQLLEIIRTAHDVTAIDRAVICLRSIGEPALPSFRQLLTGADTQAAWRAAFWLSIEDFDVSTNYAVIVPDLANATMHTNSGVALCATKALATIRVAPELSVPALINVVTSGTPNVPLRAIAMQSLGKYGSSAISALPCLEAASKDPDRVVRKEALDAIEKIKAVLTEVHSR